MSSAVDGAELLRFVSLVRPSPRLCSMLLLFSVYGCRHASQLAESNKKRAFLVGTLAMVIKEMVLDILENAVQSFVSKAELRKSEMIQESNLSKLTSQVSEFFSYAAKKKETRTNFGRASVGGARTYVGARITRTQPLLTLPEICSHQRVELSPFLHVAT